MGNYVYSGGAGRSGDYTGQNWLISFDVSNPNNITKVGELSGTLAYWMYPVTSWKGSSGSYIVIADGGINARVVDISNPSTMSIIESWTDANVITNMRNIFVNDDYMYFTATYTGGGRILVFGEDPVATTQSYTPSWWDSNWDYRRVLSFNADHINENITDFPVRIHLTSSNFDFSKAKDSGKDVRFIDKDDATQLSYEIEKWDKDAQDAILWAKVPQIDRFSQYTDFIYMYYGNASVSDNQSALSVWSGAKAVWHLSSNATSSTGKHNGTIYGEATFSNDSLPLDGINDYFKTASLVGDNYTSMTFLQWITLPAYPTGSTTELLGWGYNWSTYGIDVSLATADNTIRTNLKYTNGTYVIRDKTYTPDSPMMWGFAFDNVTSKQHFIMNGEPAESISISNTSKMLRPVEGAPYGGLNIGANSYSAGPFARATLRHTVLYDHILTWDELKANEMNRQDALLHYGGEEPSPKVNTLPTTNLIANLIVPVSIIMVIIAILVVGLVRNRKLFPPGGYKGC